LPCHSVTRFRRSQMYLAPLYFSLFLIELMFPLGSPYYSWLCLHRVTLRDLSARFFFFLPLLTVFIAPIVRCLGHRMGAFLLRLSSLSFCGGTPVPISFPALDRVLGRPFPLAGSRWPYAYFFPSVSLDHALVLVTRFLHSPALFPFLTHPPLPLRPPSL